MEPCRKLVRDRILNDILGSVEDNTDIGWRVLVLDELTTKVTSSVLRMSDILDRNVSVVEDLDKVREPQPLAAVYFIQPTLANITRLVSDFATKPLYPSAHVFFSGKLGAEGLAKIRECQGLLQRLNTLKEVPLEFQTVDSRTIVTEHPHALLKLMGESCEKNAAEADREIESICNRLLSFFISAGEAPLVRYRVGKPAEPGDPPGQTARSLVTQRLAVKLVEKIMVLQRLGTLPRKETCDLLVVDRSIDPVSPVIHAWTYEAMVYDLLHDKIEGCVYKYRAETAGGRAEDKVATLDEADDAWVVQRHAFIADVYTSLSNQFREFQAKNKAAQSGGAAAAARDASAIKSLIAALPQYREQLARLALHIQVSSELRRLTDARKLTEVGELEQDLVFGDKGSKDLITFLAENHAALEPVDKMRLFMAYLATHPEKLDLNKRNQWQKLSKLSHKEMNTITNLAYLGVSVMKAPTAAAAGALAFGNRKAKQVLRKARQDAEAEDAYTLGRFEPLLHEVISDMATGRLSPDAYPAVRPANQVDEESSKPAKAAQSVRTNRSTLASMFKSGAGGAAASTSGAAPAGGAGGGGGGGGGGGAVGGRKLVVFVVGGVVRSEMRLAHELSRSLQRDVILGSTSVETPASFLDKLFKANSLGDELVSEELA